MSDFAMWSWATVGVLALTLVYTSLRFRDPFHPSVMLVPMAMYMYGFLPILYEKRGLLEDYPVAPEREAFAQFVVFMSVLALCVGLVSAALPRGVRPTRTAQLAFTPQATRQLIFWSYVLAGLGMLSWILQLQMAGGFVAAYSIAKGGGGDLGSGYFNEAMLLAIPAVIMYMLAKAKTAPPMATIGTTVLMITPLIVQGLLGARRGPTFLAFIAIGVGWYLARAKRPPIAVAVGGIVAVGLLMLFLVSHRQDIHLGSDFQVDEEAYKERILPVEYDPGDTTFAAWSTIIAADHHQRFYWGKRYFAQLFVRPIPKQLWPTKYEDLDLGWMAYDAGNGMFDEEEWFDAIDTMPPRGTAAGMAADTFLEYQWGGLVCCFLGGLLYSRVWKMSVMKGGLWNILYLEAAAVSVYLISQGYISAWLYRLLLLGVPTYALWRVLRPKMQQTGGGGWRLVHVPDGEAPPPSAIPVRVVPATERHGA